MHEFSIAMNIVDIATEYAVREEAKSIKELEIEVGDLAGIVLEALEFSLDSAVKGTMLENATRKIIRIPGLVRCTVCRNVYESGDFFTACPRCGSGPPEILQGSELRVKSLVVE
jgi:hydrogenase nickel incorporation protein HypA/HybF